MTVALVTFGFAAIILLSFVVAPRQASVEGFFGGARSDGAAPGLWTLVLSQVTTWIFARSLMNAAILGYFFGFAGTLAYAAYYLSFLTGGFIVARIRAEGGRSVQDILSSRFGATGTTTYNIVIALRLLSEVFSNLLVVGLIFAALFPAAGIADTVAIVAIALLGLAYSAWGGLSASLRSDVVQMLFFLVVFAAALIALLTTPAFSFGAILTSDGTSGSTNGWILLAVAALQVFSYPAHDPVMMDRGFLADDRTTRSSFNLAFVISTVCILAFGMFGIQAALVGASYEGELIGTWSTMFPPWVWVALVLSLLISALSTLDSAMASAARLAVEEVRLAPRSLAGGRAVMAVFMVVGTALTLFGNASLFDAVAVSGTASMFLTPVLVATLVWKRQVALWAYVVAFSAAILGAAAYFLRASDWVAAILPDGHKYVALLAICIVVLLVGFAAVLLGLRSPSARPTGVAAAD